MPRSAPLVYCVVVLMLLSAALVLTIVRDAASLLMPICFGIGYFGRATWTEVRRLRATSKPSNSSAHVRSRADIT